jgi:hypothetical protein
MKAYLAAFAWLICLKKVCEKVQSKEYYLVEQGLRKLEAEEQKELNTVVAESLTVLMAYQLPLANSFVFNPFFLILPDLLNSNTPVFFP